MTEPTPAPVPTPTPVGPAHPWRRVLRTILANLGAFLIVVPIIVNTIGLDPNTYPRVGSFVVGITLVTAAITRVLAIPQVDAWLKQTISWLSADDVAAENVAAIKVGDQIVAGPAAIYDDGSEVAVTPIPVNKPSLDDENVLPRRAEPEDTGVTDA